MIWLALGIWAFAVFVLPMQDTPSFSEWFGWAVLITVLLTFSFGLAAVLT